MKNINKISVCRKGTIRGLQAAQSRVGCRLPSISASLRHACREFDEHLATENRQTQFLKSLEGRNPVESGDEPRA